MTEFKPLPLWLRPREPDPRTESRLADCRRWMALRGIYGPRSVYRPGPGTGPGTGRPGYWPPAVPGPP